MFIRETNWDGSNTLVTSCKVDHTTRILSIISVDFFTIQKDSFHIFPAFRQACGWPRSRSRRPFFPLPAILDGRAQVDRLMPQVNQTMSYPTLSHEFTSAWLNFVTISTGLSNEYLHQQGIFQFPGHHLVPSEVCSTEP